MLKNSIKNILVIGPHPDDLEFGCGATLYKFLKEKVKINLLVMTDGEYGGNTEIRKKEQEKAAKILNANLLWGNLKDTEVPIGRELINLVEKHIKKISPDLILVNYKEDTHQDHRNVAQAVLTASRYINNVMFYEVPTSINFNPNIFCNIEKEIKIKTKLLQCHHSQVNKTKVSNLSILESAKSTAVFRGFQARVKYAEGFIAQRILLNSFLF